VKARELTRRAVDSAQRADEPEAAAEYRAAPLTLVVSGTFSTLGVTIAVK
jgi:hypothetical protein